MVNAQAAAEGKYLKPEHIDPNNNVAVIIDGGQYVEGKFGKKLEIGINYKKLVKSWSVNSKTAENLIHAYGEDTDEWVGKKVVLEIFKSTNGNDAIIGSAPGFKDAADVEEEKVESNTEEAAKGQDPAKQ